MKNTSLHRVLLGWGESRGYWWPWDRYRPQVSARIPWIWVWVHAFSGFVGFGIPGALLGRAVMGSWVMEAVLLCGAVGAFAGFLWCAMVRGAWNLRAGEMAAAVAEGRAAVIPAPRTLVDRCLMAPGVWVAGLVISVSVVWGIENLRGVRELRRFEAELRAKGAPVMPGELEPPAVPESENLAEAPMFRSLFQPRSGAGTGGVGVGEAEGGVPRGEAAWNVQAKTPSFEAFRAERRRAEVKRAKQAVGPMEGVGGWAEGRAVDLGLWQAYYRSLPDWRGTEEGRSAAEDVLVGLRRIEPELRELRKEAAGRRSFRFDLRYEDGFSMVIPHVAHSRKIATALQLRAVACLAGGRSEEALADTLLGLRMGDGLADEPVLISALVRIAIDGLMLQPVWEGCVERRWSEAECAELQRVLGQRDYLRGMRRALEGERVLLRPAYETVARSGPWSWWGGQPDAFEGMVGSGQGDATDRMIFWMVRLMPQGWVRQNEVVHGRYLRELVEDLERARFRGDGPSADERFERMIHRRGPWMVIAKMLAPAVGKAVDRAYVMEANRRMALVGLGLERYRQVVGGYPEEVGLLVPRFLSTLSDDPMTGRPLRYERVSADRYRLYSVGVDGRDDGGVRGERRARTAMDGGGPRDLVWQ